MKTLFLLVGLTCGIVDALHSPPASAQTAAQRLVASDGERLDFFGASVSLGNDVALVGAPNDHNENAALGSVYVFERLAGNTWIESLKLTSSDDAPNHGEFFGGSVSLSGYRVLVGAPRSVVDGIDRGAAYIFERDEDSSWNQTAKLTASDGELEDAFGTSVSISDDLAIVGATGHDALGTNSGAAYVFERQENGFWIEIAKLTASDVDWFDTFGGETSLSGDRAIVAATGNDDGGTSSGAAYVFERSGDGSWLEVAKLTASDASSEDLFGIAVSISNDIAVIGAWRADGLALDSGAAYVFTREPSGSWNEAARLIASDGAEGDHLGSALALWGNSVAIGSPHDGFAGSVYVYTQLENGSWIQAEKLYPIGPDSGALFGDAVAFVENDLLAGAPQDFGKDQNSGVAYVFENVLPVANENPASPPETYNLSHPYPNPFNPQAEFSLEISEPQHVQIDVVNTLGQHVGILHDGILAGPATHPFTFDAGSLPSGVYLLRVTGETFTAARTMTLLK